jgi:kynureninase
MGGINYYSGQVFDMKIITQKAQFEGAKVGLDLVYCAGNSSLDLHEWNVDFAVWCSYKYLNSMIWVA